MSQLEQNYQNVKDRLRRATSGAQRNTTPILLAVSKKHDIEKISALYQMGQRHFGESYVQEAVAKIEQLGEFDITWHFIGPIQSNKTKLLAAHFDWVQSVDRMKLLRRLNQQRPAEMQPLNVLLQLKVGDEDSKSGADFTSLRHMAEAMHEMEGLCLRGIMCIPPPADDKAQQCLYFQEARQAFQQLQQEFPTMDTLSMGMSNDLEAAVETGSTMVRVGTDIFGKRPQ